MRGLALGRDGEKGLGWSLGCGLCSQTSGPEYQLCCVTLDAVLNCSILGFLGQLGSWGGLQEEGVPETQGSSRRRSGEGGMSPAERGPGSSQGRVLKLSRCPARCGVAPGPHLVWGLGLCRRG